MDIFIGILIWMALGLPSILFSSLIWYRDFDRITLGDLLSFTFMGILGGPITTIISFLLIICFPIFDRIDTNMVIFDKRSNKKWGGKYDDY